MKADRKAERKPKGNAPEPQRRGSGMERTHIETSRAKLFFRRAREWCVLRAKVLWDALSHRFGLKLLSLGLAILLWNYVISTNSSITRSKTLTGLSGYVTGQSTLNTYRLAMTSDPTQSLTGLTVRLDVAQSQYSAVSANNVQVMLDLSSVRTAGTQQVPLRATSSYGRVTDIMPESVTLTFEPLDSRLIPINVELTGEQDAAHWYNVARTDPTSVTVSGAASLVRSINQARIYTDVSGQTGSYWRAEPFVLLDSEGNEIPQSTLTFSVSSVTTTVDVYPTREIPISTAIENVVTGRVAAGYTITDVSIQPESVTVAANQSLLDGISELLIEPVDVEGQSQSMAVRARIAQLSDFRNVSSEQVYVNITIAEEVVSVWVTNNVLTFVGKADDLDLSWKPADVKVRVSGPKSAVQALQESGVPITIDLTGLGPGEHSCALNFPVDNYPELSFEPEVPAITVTLTQITSN